VCATLRSSTRAPAGRSTRRRLVEEQQRVLVPSIMSSGDVRLTYQNLIDILPVLR
jgi:hypothetical protein